MEALARPRLIVVALAGLLSACAAPNPRRSSTEVGSAGPAPAQPTSVPSPAPVPAAAPQTAAAAAAPAVTNPAAAKDPSAALAESPAQSASEPLVAVVAGRPVYVSELLTQWVYARNFEVLKQLDNLALGRIVAAEAQRLGVSIAPSLVTAAAEESVVALEAEVKKKNPKLGFDTYVDRVLGLDPIRYRERLRDDALRQLLADRVARAWLLGMERREVRIVVAKEESVRDAVQRELAEGRDFSEIARQHSMDPSGAAGGRIPPVVKGDSPIAKLAFSTEPSKIAGPIQEAGRWLFLLVDAEPPVVSGAWDQIAAQVETDLRARAVEELEIAQWRAAMQARYEVDFQPFLRLVGQIPR
jgi:parvulin-like peptidyl-prolyl isomerase